MTVHSMSELPEILIVVLGYL